MRSGQIFLALATGIPRAIPAAFASAESARMVARSAPGAATATGRSRSTGATKPSTAVQKAGGSMKRTERFIKVPSSEFRVSAETIPWCMALTTYVLLDSLTRNSELQQRHLPFRLHPPRLSPLQLLASTSTLRDRKPELFLQL